MDVCTRDRLRFAFVLRFSGSIRTARCVSTRLLSLFFFSHSFFLIHRYEEETVLKRSVYNEKSYRGTTDFLGFVNLEKFPIVFHA